MSKKFKRKNVKHEVVVSYAHTGNACDYTQAICIKNVQTYANTRVRYLQFSCGPSWRRQIKQTSITALYIVSTDNDDSESSIDDWCVVHTVLDR